MKIDRESKPAEQTRSEQIRNMLKRAKPKPITDPQAPQENRRQRKPLHRQQRPET